MKLYDGGRAPNPRRVRIFLAEKNIPVPLVAVDINKLEHKSAAFTAMNPMQRVPLLLLDDGTAIAESIAICRFFEILHPRPALFGRDAREQALVEMWSRRLELGLLVHVANVLRHANPALAHLEVPQVAEVANASRRRVDEFLSQLDAELSGRTFVTGGDFSVADITGLVAIDLMKPAKLAVHERLSNVARWHAALWARPSAAA